VSNYIPWHGKKREHVELREEKLRRLLLKGSSTQKLNQAAEEARAARIRLLKSNSARIPPIVDALNSLRRERIHAAITACLATPIEVLIQSCRKG
jgi:hypothetical protein